MFSGVRAAHSSCSTRSAVSSPHARHHEDCCHTAVGAMCCSHRLFAHAPATPSHATPNDTLSLGGVRFSFAKLCCAPPRPAPQLCRTYATTGACHYGNRCRFIHAMPPSVGVGAAGALSFSDMPHTSHRDFVFPDVGLQGPGAPGPAHGRASLDEAALRGGGAVGEPEDLAAAGGGQQLQRATEAAAAMLWSPAREPHGVQVRTHGRHTVRRIIVRPRFYQLLHAGRAAFFTLLLVRLRRTPPHRCVIKVRACSTIPKFTPRFS